MKKMERWKKVILLIATVIVLLRIGYIAFRGEVDKQYYTSTSYDLTDATSVPISDVTQTFTSTQDRLHSLEFLFTNIADDKAGAVVLKIYSDEELIYQTNITLANVNNWEWKRVYINAELSPEKEYKIVLSPTDACTQLPEVPVVKSSGAAEIEESRSGEQIVDGDIAINYGYLRYPSVPDRLVMISICILLWIAVFAGVYCFESIMNVINKAIGYAKKQVKTQMLVSVLEVFGCTIIINSSGIGFQDPTKVVLYAISLIATVNCVKKYEYVKTLTDASWKKVLVILLYFYAAFALVGQRIWIYPLTTKINMAGFFVYLCAVLWFVPVVQSILYYLEKACLHSFTNKPRFKSWQFAIIVVVILLIPAAYNLFAFNPGMSSTDTFVTMVENAQNLHGADDWHPAFYCMVLRAIQKVWNSTYAVILVQHFFWVYVMTELMIYLRKKGIRDSITIAVTLFSGFNAANYLHINTIWKDIPYTLSLVWALIIVAKLSMDFEKYKHKWYIYLEFIVAFVGMYLYRKNGMVTFIVITVPLVMVLRRNIKLLISLVLTVAVIFTIKGPLYDYFDIQDTGKRGIYIGLSQDILGVYYSGGEVSEETLQMINVMTNYNNGEYSYNPTWSKQSYDLDVDTKEFIMNYIDTFIKNPVLMTRAIIAREDALWDIYKGQDVILGCVNYTDTMDNWPPCPSWSEIYDERQYVSLYTKALEACTYTASSQWISAIEWRCGLFTLLGLISSVFLLAKKGKGKYLLIITPAVGHIIGLLLSTGWSEFRYYWPLNLLNMAMILFVVIIGKKGTDVVEE